MDSDLMPNDGTFYHLTEPEEQKAEESQERAKVQQGMQLLEEIIADFEQRIAFYDSTKSIGKDLQTNPDEFMHTYAAYQIVSENLTQIKEKYESKRDAYKT